MKRIIIGLLVLSSLFLSGCRKGDVSPLSPTSTPKVKDVNEIFDIDNMLRLVNQYRQILEAPELTKSASLCELAQNRANFLIVDNMKGFLESKPQAHIGMPEQKIGYNFAGEALMGIDIAFLKDLIDTMNTCEFNNKTYDFDEFLKMIDVHILNNYSKVFEE